MKWKGRVLKALQEKLLRQDLFEECCDEFTRESVALEGTGHRLARDVAPGEALFIDLEGNVHARQCAEAPTLNPCMFEFVYLARPDSVMDGAVARLRPRSTSAASSLALVSLSAK